MQLGSLVSSGTTYNVTVKIHNNEYQTGKLRWKNLKLNHD